MSDTFKVVVLGAPGVGKSALVIQHVASHFQELYGLFVFPML